MSLYSLIAWCLLFGILHASSANFFAWTDVHTSNIPLYDQCIAIDASKDTLYTIGGRDGNGFLHPTFRKFRIKRLGSSVSITRVQHPSRLFIDIIGFVSPLPSGFACTPTTTVAYHNGFAFVLGANDGASNNPVCMKCDMSTGKCILLPCKARFSSCFVRHQNFVFQIGGTASFNIFNDILCFDLDVGDYTACPSNRRYGRLAASQFEAQCHMDANGKITIFGGNTPVLQKSPRIQTCSPDGRPCRFSTPSLPRSADFANIFGHEFDPCMVYYFGGTDSNFVASDTLLLYDVCREQIVSTAIEGRPIASYGAAKFNGVLCFIGGVRIDFNFVLYGEVACRPYGAAPPPTTTLAPSTNPTRYPSKHPTTTRRPTKQPSQSPATLSPSPGPTKSPTAKPTPVQVEPGYLGDWRVKQNYTIAKLNPICAVNDLADKLYVMGGITGTKVSQVMDVLDVSRLENGPLRTVSPSIKVLSFEVPLSALFCQHKCAFTYKNKMFLVAPQHSDARNRPAFYRCEMTADNSEVTCFDLCSRISCLDLGFEPCVAVDDDKMYIAGGARHLNFYSNIQEFDMETETWLVTWRNALPIAVHAAACGIWDGSLYLLGGSTVNRRATNHIQRCFLSIYSGQCDVMSVALSKNTLFGHVEVVKGSMVMGCFIHENGEVDSKPMVFDLKTSTFRATEQVPTYFGGERHSCCMTRSAREDKLILVGGDVVSGLTVQGVGGIDESFTRELIRWEDCLEVSADIPVLKNQVLFTQVRAGSYQYAVWKARAPSSNSVLWMYWSGIEWVIWLPTGTLFAPALDTFGRWEFYDAPQKRIIGTVRVRLHCVSMRAVSVENIEQPQKLLGVSIAVAVGILCGVFCIGACAGGVLIKRKYAFRIPANALPEHNSGCCCCRWRSRSVTNQIRSPKRQDNIELARESAVMVNRTSAHTPSSELEVDPCEIRFDTHEVKTEIESSIQKDYVDSSGLSTSDIRVTVSDDIMFPKRYENSLTHPDKWGSPQSYPSPVRRRSTQESIGESSRSSLDRPHGIARYRPMQRLNSDSERTPNRSPNMSPNISPNVSPGISPYNPSPIIESPNWAAAAAAQQLGSAGEHYYPGDDEESLNDRIRTLDL